MKNSQIVGDYLVSAGKDGLIKVWDLSTNFCMETHLAHRGEVWALAVSPSHDVCCHSWSGWRTQILVCNTTSDIGYGS